MNHPRLAQFSDVLESLPDLAPTVPLTDGGDADIDHLGHSIATLAARLAQRQERDAMMASITTQVMQGVYLDEILDHVYEGFRGLIPYDRIGLALLEDEGRIARARWARSDAGEMVLSRGFAAKMSGSSLQDVMATGRPRILNDLERYATEHPKSHSTQLVIREGIRSSLTCPLIALGKPIGFLFFSSRQPHQYATVHTDAFDRLAGLISAVVEKGALYEQLSTANAALREARDALQIEATHDALTGMLNRRAVLAFLANMLAMARRRDRSGAVILVDIDHFKRINDTHGHPAGDAVLREVAQRIAAKLRAGDSAGRYGGEEFLICLDDCTHTGAMQCAERLLSAIHDTPVTIPGGEVRVTMSVGLVHRSHLRGENAEHLIQQADHALYDAKGSGRDRIVEALSEPGNP
ncbi:MAG: sensor domain-containing diguanylate cyclase [Gemmatimonas sp.]